MGKQTKFIAVSGGVISGIGKGVIASSTGLLLKTLGLRVTAIKIDPYMNIDAGTMAPTEHGEVFVLNDGGEVDLDLGNYERYLDVTLSKENNITTGKIYREVIEKERRGDYLGKTVQIVPHLTDAIQDWLQRVGSKPIDDSGEEPDVCIVELGGTVGDIESAPFVEALRQFQFRVGQENFALIHVSLVPVVGGEQKTKPTQAAIRDLRGLGLVPDIIAARCQQPLDRSVISKLSMFCHVGPDQVMAVHDVSSTYHVPLLLEEQGLLNFLTRRLKLDTNGGIPAAMKEQGQILRTRWRDLTSGHDRLIDKVEIVLVGKYTSLQDSYMSVVKALEHASLRVHRKLTLKWVEAGDLEPATANDNPVRYHEAWQAVCSAKGIIVPGGFGHRGTEGMISAAKWARTKKVPFLGICLGFQISVIEYARNVCGLKDAGSSELDEKCPHPVVIYMPEISKTHMGGTMRLGLRPTLFQDGTQSSSKIGQLYGSSGTVWERHRHRYEINPEYVERIEKGAAGSKTLGTKRPFVRRTSVASAELEYDDDEPEDKPDRMRFIGKDEKGERMQILELEEHPYFVCLQAHPEFASRPLNPSPPFLGLIAASAGVLDEHCKAQQSFVPPHPSAWMIPESEAKAARDAHQADIDGEPISDETNGKGTKSGASKLANALAVKLGVNGADTPPGSSTPKTSSSSAPLPQP
ncbi:CTP synthase ura7 [Tilletia horrida]|uniref:CTP synthase n=1 Tax=Tilletia horrida TaxID=155126 RepID=A0AAN6GS12_9BASI|nr:CTP synthase ura7 [Tilletia horrida]KAK0554510.1 CTP synthase ura7 [Tilletia horrida]KAK0568104.1 CTP synthase ura7 [Tilletia horrida]